MTFLLRKTLIAVFLASCVRVASAQVGKSDDADTTQWTRDDAAPRFASGVTAGALSFSTGRSEQALSILLEFRPVSWLSLSATPGFGRTTFGSLSSTGPTDIPLASAAMYSPENVSWSPSFVGSLSTVISTGQAGSTLGVGRTAMIAGAGASVAPLRHTSVAADVSHPLTTASGNGSADVWLSRSLGFATPSLGYSTEIGSVDSAATLARSVAGGVVVRLANPLSLAIDGAHGLTPGAPRWTLSVSLGSAYGGISPVSGASLFGRLKNAFGSRALSSSGYSKSPSGGTSCRKLGTC